jgi:Holliday junction resolvase RusA-like endonuclease
MMKTVYDFFVKGIVKAQPRPRMTKTGHVYTPDSAKTWKELVTAECLARRQPVIDEPVKLTVCFYFPFPRSAKNKKRFCPHTVKPDADNLLKAVMDALTEAKAWTDDAVVYSSRAEKWYTRDNVYGARVTIEIWEEEE